MLTPAEILKTYWGYDSFREPQLEIIQAVLEGKDTLALLPTGGGKSVCFQVPGLAKEGICLVISPLVALMEDQVNQLKKRGITAHAIHSGIFKKDIDRILDNCIHGNVKFLYVAPERLHTELFIARLKQMNVNLVAIDESHCISQWGHDFRPAYLTIAGIREFIPNVPFIALTATATELVKKDIISFLELKQHAEFSKSFSRDNIRFIVRKTSDKRAKVLEICQKIGGSTIIYADTRKHTKDYADLLNQNGIPARYYHAGLDPEEKSLTQTRWISGEVRVICATNAFGMGIDKADVRLVIHPHLPSEPEAFYQEAGRAGRDGKTSLSVLVYTETDLETLDTQLELKYPKPEAVKRIYSLLFQEFQIAFGTGKEFSSPFDITGFSLKHGIQTTTVYYALKILEKAGFLALQNFGRERSKLMFKVSHTEVYKFQVAHQNLDDVLTVIIRSYGGLFEHMVSIDEKAIASRAKLTLPVLHGYLDYLVEAGIINYQKKTSQPILTFLESRVQENYLSIPSEVYQVRKKKDEERIEVMKNLAQRERCRMNMLLKYFGEAPEGTCGHCDICSRLHKLGVNPKEFEEISTAIKISLKYKALSPEELQTKLPKFKPESVSKLVRWMVDEGVVRLNNQELFELAD
ncbi:MAG: ATP-dependent DNA helicase RecQ [Flavobacteriales bacterium]